MNTNYRQIELLIMSQEKCILLRSAMYQEPKSCDSRTANSREAENSSVKQKVNFMELFSYPAKCLPIFMFS